MFIRIKYVAGDDSAWLSSQLFKRQRLGELSSMMDREER
jgi:hypothetical protein